MVTKIKIGSKQDYLELLDAFNKEGKHLHYGIWTRKVVFIENGVEYIKLNHTSFDKALPLMETKKVSYPIEFSCETPKMGMTLDIKVSKIREEYFIEFDAAPSTPIPEFLLDEYQEQIQSLVESIQPATAIPIPVR